MKYLASLTLASTLLASAAVAVIPQTKNGVYHYNHDTKQHTRLGDVKRASGAVHIPRPSGGGKPGSAAPKKKGKSGVRRREADLASDEQWALDFDLLAGRDLDLIDEDDIYSLLARAMDEDEVEFGSLVERRGSSGFSVDKSGCGQSVVSYTDFGNAYEAFSLACSTAPTAKPKTSLYAVSGSAMVFMCNYATNYDNPCRTPELLDATNYIFDKCPNYMTGWAQSFGWYKSYGYDVAGTSICGF